MRLSGKTAVVTGGARGLGAHMCQMFAAEGAQVIAVDLGEMTYSDKGVEYYQLNITDAEGCKKFFDGTIEKYGKIDILVNNAGMSDSTKVEKYEEGQFDKVMRLNVNALFNAIQPSVEIMREQGGGCILNTSSMVSISGQPGGVAYPTSKFAVNGMTLSLARELGPSNIRVNAVAPGITKTDMVAALPDQMIQPMIAAIPLRRIGEPEDIANAFLFLASDMASYVTGEILSVDGAMRA